MTKKARLWTGMTLFVIVAFNYGIIGLPLYRKAANLHNNATSMVMKQVKSGNVLKASAEEDYILDIFRREKASIDRKLVVLNAAAITILILIASWMAFGVLAVRKK